jgi:uncharacterized protein (DUF885 family)
MTPFQLADALVDDLAALSPTAATYWGVPGHDHRWEDLSPDGAAHHATVLRDWRVRVATLPPQTERWSRLAVHVLEDHLDLALDGFTHGDERRDLNHLASTFQGLVRTFDAMDTSTTAGWEAVAARLEALEGAVDGYQRTLAQGLARGEGVAARQVRSVVAQGRVHASEGGSFAGLPGRLRGLAVGDAALERRLDAASLRGRAAYHSLTNWLEQVYLPAATPVDAVGRDRYARAARRSVGGTVDLEETLAWGWAEVRAIQARMAVVAAAMGPEPVGDLVLRLQTEPAFAAPSAEVFLEEMAARQQHALEALAGAHFDVPAPLRRLDVKRAPPGGPPGAYYVPPSEDLSRPGAVWYSLTDGPQARWDEVSTAYHEGFPGHHLQVGLQVALREHLCRVHRVAYGYSGYAEGWALYAEALMGELGYYERPEYELGMLANQLMRACRVVFDIGAHLDVPIPADAPFHPGARWSFDLGVELMASVGGMTRATAESEVTRYLGWPGQAISYKVGQRAMLALRADFLATGGTLRQFHDRVLGCGNVGLALLRAEVLAPA